LLIFLTVFALNLEAISEVFFLYFLSQRGPIPAYLSSVAFSIASDFTSLQGSHHCLRPQPHSHSTLSPTSFPSPIMRLPLLKFPTLQPDCRDQGRKIHVKALFGQVQFKMLK
jgi:hypothetical protein